MEKTSVRYINLNDDIEFDSLAFHDYAKFRSSSESYIPYIQLQSNSITPGAVNSLKYGRKSISHDDAYPPSYELPVYTETTADGVYFYYDKDSVNMKLFSGDYDNDINQYIVSGDSVYLYKPFTLIEQATFDSLESYLNSEEIYSGYEYSPPSASEIQMYVDSGYINLSTSNTVVLDNGSHKMVWNNSTKTFDNTEYQGSEIIYNKITEYSYNSMIGAFLKEEATQKVLDHFSTGDCYYRVQEDYYRDYELETISYFTTDIDEFEEFAQIMPNPFSQTITIELQNSSKRGLQGQLVTLQGKVVHRFTIQTGLSSYQLHIPDLISGIYILVLQSDANIHTFKILKQ